MGGLARMFATGFCVDRRGVIAPLTAATMTAMLGCAGLATEAGVWYLTQLKEQSAADLAALAGTIAYANGGSATSVATSVAAANGFATGGKTTVTVNTPPSAGPNIGTSGAVEVVIRQTPALLFASLFLNSAPPITARAVAGLKSVKNACVLGLGGSGYSSGVVATGNAVYGGPGCDIASNANVVGSASVSLGGSSSITAYSIVSEGTCSGCSGSNAILSRPAQQFQPPTSNPFANLDSKALPTFAGSSCTSSSGGTTTLVPYETSGQGYCNSTIKVNGGATLTVTPGTYYLYNTSLTVNGGGSIVCSGCDLAGGQGVTFVFTGSGSNVGDLQLNGNGLIQLVAPKNSADPDYNGVLFYRTSNGTDSTTVDISGNSSSTVAGGAYFPGSQIQFIGNSGTSQSKCTAFVAAQISLSGSSDTAVDTSGCSSYGTSVPQTQAAQLLE
jgi:Flp pilus assembly protein TadG